MKTSVSIFFKIICIIVFSGSGFMAAKARDNQQSMPPLAKREIPEITFKNLSPPYKDYDYFKNHEELGFQFNQASFNLVNAWWLAEVSTLVYADEDFVRQRLGKAGLPQVKFFDEKSTQCYVASNDKFAIVAFRGSEIWKKKGKFDLSKVLADLRADVDIRLADWPQGGKVHRGFSEALDEVWSELLPYLRGLDERGCKIWTTGHSLGAALATLCADRFGNVQGVYTYGSPRVGNEDFKKNLDEKIYRIVNNDDIVPRLPPPGTYVHVGELMFIDNEGIICDHMPESDFSGDPPRDETYGQKQNNKDTFAGFVPAPFRDHVPLLYAVHLWNNIVKNQGNSPHDKAVNALHQNL